MKYSTLGFNPKYDDNREENKIYIGKSITDKELEKSYRCVSVIIPDEKGLLSEKNLKIEEEQRKYFDEDNKEFISEKIDFNVVDGITLGTSSNGQQKFACWLVEDKENKGIRGLHIARRTKKGVYSNQEVTLAPNAIISLKNLRLL